MSRPLRPHLNQIRVWVRQGRTDAWIAHQLDVSADEIETFKREQSLDAEGASSSESQAAVPGVEAEPDLRAEDDALIAAELEAALAEREAAEAAGLDDDDAEDGSSRRRRRGRRGGRGRRRPTFEASFDHGEEGYGLWLDPAIVDDPVYAEHWAGHRPISVMISADQIVITRASEAGEATDEESSEDSSAAEPASEAQAA